MPQELLDECLPEPEATPRGVNGDVGENCDGTDWSLIRVWSRPGRMWSPAEDTKASCHQPGEQAGMPDCRWRQCNQQT